MKRYIPLFVICSFCTLRASPMTIDLGTAGPFAVLAGSTVTNTGFTNIYGNLGLAPGSSITGFPPGIVTGTIDDADAAAMQAQSALTMAYDSASGQPCGVNLTGQNLGGLTLTPGVYCFNSSAALTGILTLDDLGNPNAEFVFEIGSTLTTASNSSVVFDSGQDANLFWQVTSSATLGTGTEFAGNILALTSITLNTDANITCGRALAQNGAVTMDSNNVTINGCETGGAVPEPGTGVLLGAGMLLGLIVGFTASSEGVSYNKSKFSEETNPAG